MYSEPLTAAITEAESLVAAAPHIETEADLLEGLQYLAQGVAACVHGAIHFDKDHPFLLSGTGPFTKMGLDNPDTMYFGARVDGAHEYMITGRRGTTADISFQVLGGGEYTDDNVPASTVAFDDRELTVDADGRFEVRFGPGEPGPDYYRLPPGKAQLVIREVFDDWSAQRSTFAIAASAEVVWVRRLIARVERSPQPLSGSQYMMKSSSNSGFSFAQNFPGRSGLPLKLNALSP